VNQREVAKGAAISLRGQAAAVEAVVLDVAVPIRIG